MMANKEAAKREKRAGVSAQKGAAPDGVSSGTVVGAVSVPSPLERLPAELQALIFGSCSVKDLLGLCVVSRLFTNEARRALVAKPTLRTRHDIRTLLSLLDKHPWLAPSVVRISQTNVRPSKYTNRELNAFPDVAPLQGRQWVKQTTTLAARCDNLRSLTITSPDFPRLWHSLAFQTAARGLRELSIDGRGAVKRIPNTTIPVFLAQVAVSHPVLASLSLHVHKDSRPVDNPLAMWRAPSPLPHLVSLYFVNATSSEIRYALFLSPGVTHLVLASSELPIGSNEAWELDYESRFGDAYFTALLPDLRSLKSLMLIGEHVWLLDWVDRMEESGRECFPSLDSLLVTASILDVDWTLGCVPLTVRRLSISFSEAPTNLLFPRRPDKKQGWQLIDTIIGHVSIGAKALERITVYGNVQGCRNRAQRRALRAWSTRSGVEVDFPSSHGATAGQ